MDSDFDALGASCISLAACIESRRGEVIVEPFGLLPNEDTFLFQPLQIPAHVPAAEPFVVAAV